MMGDEVSGLLSRWELGKCYEVCSLGEAVNNGKNYRISLRGWKTGEKSAM